MGKQQMPPKEKGDYVGSEIHTFQAKGMGTTAGSHMGKKNQEYICAARKK